MTDLFCGWNFKNLVLRYKKNATKKNCTCRTLEQIRESIDHVSSLCWFHFLGGKNVLIQIITASENHSNEL